MHDQIETQRKNIFQKSRRYLSQRRVFDLNRLLVA